MSFRTLLIPRGRRDLGRALLSFRSEPRVKQGRAVRVAVRFLGVRSMCLAIPAKIVCIEDTLGIVDMAGIQKKVSLILLEEPQVGDYVIVHAGFGIHKIDEEVAMESLKILREAASLLDEGGSSVPEEDSIQGFGTGSSE